VTDVSPAGDHLAVIGAVPRPAGGSAEAQARAHCAEVLRTAGFDVKEYQFEYSAFPGRYATALGGVTSTLLVVAAMLVVARGRPGAATAILVSGGAALAAAARWTARVGVVDAPWMRRRASNLVATRGAAEPTLWMVAHLDSKSQPIPMLVRAGAIVLHGAIWFAALLLCVASWLAEPVPATWASIGIASVLTGLPIMATVVGDRSAGAVDNASGVVAVLLAAAALPRALSIGVLFTSAEELGLAGARAWARGRAPAIALNCDGIDDAGQFLCMYSGRRPVRVVEAYERAARAEGYTLRVRRLLPGVLVDGVALADAGWAVLTLSRGTIATLARIHTGRDTLATLTGAGVEDAVPLLTRVAEELT
jgi:hypothetical protein